MPGLCQNKKHSQIFFESSDKMRELIVLGTGSAMVTHCFNTRFALHLDNEYFLVDAGGGNGILRQLEQAKIDARQIHHLFVTHGHTDHVCWGVIWVIRKIATLINQGNMKGFLQSIVIVN